MRRAGRTGSVSEWKMEWRVQQMEEMCERSGTADFDAVAEEKKRKREKMRKRERKCCKTI